MSKAVYGVIDGQTRKVTKQYAVIDGSARKIKKSYAVIDGVARLFYLADKVEYTGARFVSQINIAGKAYELHTLTSSGTLKLHADAQYWMCGGGGGGCPSAQTNPSTGTISSLAYSGGGGGGGYTAKGSLPKGEHLIIIGGGGGLKLMATDMNASLTGTGGDTKIGSSRVARGGSNGGAVGSYNTMNYRQGGSGGSGGGSGGYYRIEDDGSVIKYQNAPGSGEGISTYPFGIASLHAHSAGGSGGRDIRYNDSSALMFWAGGGNGGSNGSDGDAEISGYGTHGGLGGEHGGANVASINANFYGGGGSGRDRKYYEGTRGITTYAEPGYGYQGVVYILIPAT